MPTTDAPQLFILPSLQVVPRPSGRVVLTRKFLEGMDQFLTLWPGILGAVMGPMSEVSDNLDNVEIAPEELPFALTVLPLNDPKLADVLTRAAVVLAGIDHRQSHISSLCRRLGVPCVYGAEYTLRTRCQVVCANTRNPVLRLRRMFWEWNLERKQVRAIRAATGIQCNGIPTYDAYRAINERPMYFFDTRVDDADLIGEDALHERLGHVRDHAPLRLAFSGRLIPMKGADDLPRVSSALRNLQTPHHLTICGGGSLEPRIERDVAALGLQHHVSMRGVLDFHTELLPLLKRSIDLFVCPHRQGDPSCTYHETLSCGVPIVGYANEAFRGIIREADVGIAVPMNDPDALADAVRLLHEDRDRLIQLSRNALAFARRHTFTRGYRNRVAHLLQCAGLPLPNDSPHRPDTPLAA